MSTMPDKKYDSNDFRVQMRRHRIELERRLEALKRFESDWDIIDQDMSPGNKEDSKYPERPERMELADAFIGMPALEAVIKYFKEFVPPGEVRMRRQIIRALIAGKATHGKNKIKSFHQAISQGVRHGLLKEPSYEPKRGPDPQALVGLTDTPDEKFVI